MAEPETIVEQVCLFMLTLIKVVDQSVSLAEDQKSSSMVRLRRALIALLMLAPVFLTADDLDEFEAMMAEPAERKGWIDPMDMGLDSSSSGGVQSCDLGAVGKELQVCKEALRRALLERNETSSKPVQVLVREFIRMQFAG